MTRSLPTFKLERKLWRKNYLVIGIDEVGRGALAGPLVVGAVCFYPISGRYRIFHSFKTGICTSLLDSIQYQENDESKFFETCCLRPTAPSAELSRDKISGESFSDFTINLENLGINDSKKLSPKKREELAKFIKNVCLSRSVSEISVSFINKYGISKAFQIGIRNALKNLQLKKIDYKRFSIPCFSLPTFVKTSAGKQLECNVVPSLVEGSLKTGIFESQFSKIFLLVDGFHVKYLRGVTLKRQTGIVKGDQKSISIAAASIIAKVHRDQLMVKLGEKYKRYFWQNNKGYGTEKHIEAIKKHGKTVHHRNLYLRKIYAKSTTASVIRRLPHFFDT